MQLLFRLPTFGLFPTCNNKCKILVYQTSIYDWTCIVFLFPGEADPQHAAECSILSRLETPPDFVPDSFCREYAAVLPLRLLKIRDTDPDLWTRVDGLMDHLDQVKTALMTILFWRSSKIFRNLQLPHNRHACNFSKIMFIWKICSRACYRPISCFRFNQTL